MSIVKKYESEPTDTFEEAKQARIATELKYFEEFSPSLNVIE